MLRTLAVALSIFCSGCATNQLHLTAYTTPNVLATLRDAASSANVTTISGIETCTSCSEMSKIVWHPANYPYEGFHAIPIDDWKGFIKDSLETPPAPPNLPSVSITIDRIFLKTWQRPSYFACQVQLRVQTEGTTRSGKASIKISGVGQRLVQRDVAILDPVTMDALRLAIRAAYVNAMTGKPSGS